MDYNRHTVKIRQWSNLISIQNLELCVTVKKNASGKLINDRTKKVISIRVDISRSPGKKLTMA